MEGQRLKTASVVRINIRIHTCKRISLSCGTDNSESIFDESLSSTEKVKLHPILIATSRRSGLLR